MGDAGVIVGRPRPVERFPGDPRPGENRLPRTPKAPTATDRHGIEQQEPVSVDDVVAATALPAGNFNGPVAGYLYFRYRGKTKSIKSLELVVESKTGPLTLALK
jgi:hypothetical protein